jgi:sec-independent protein translocase protein TatA
MFHNVEFLNLGFMGAGPMELAIVGGIFLLLFGGAKLPSLMRNLGRSANEFKRGMADSTDDVEEPAEPRRDKV